MNRISVTRHVEFEAAHMLSGYDGPCGNLHGHSYAMEVTVSCPEFDRRNNKFNFVIDFGKLDKILKSYIPDHSFIVNVCTQEGCEYELYQVLKKYNKRIFEMINTPSAENMVKKFAQDLQKILENEFKDIECTIDEIRLWETTNSHATWLRG